jgi:protein kinase A
MAGRDLPGGLGKAAAAYPGAEGWELRDFELKETLGTGTFGRVRLARHKTLDKYFALKALKKREVIRMKQVDHIMQEAAILSEIHHPFVVNMLRGFQDEQRLYILLEYVVGGEMFTHLRKAGKFPLAVAKFYTGEVMLALEYLHSLTIVYRDLKPENLLLDGNGHVKITDFGFAKKVAERTFTLCGTPEYLAPEIIQNKGHGKAVDWWAFGILMYEMLVGYPPFFDESPFRIYEKILEGKLQFPKWIDPRGMDLVKGLLQTDHTKRLGSLKRGVQDIRKHKFYQGVDWEVLLSRKIPAPIPVRVCSAGDSRYFDRYPESVEVPNQAALSTKDQDLFKDFATGGYDMAKSIAVRSGMEASAV